MDDERTGVHPTDGIDETGPPRPGTTQVEAREWVTQGREVEERVARQDVGPIHEPVVELTLLGLGGMQFVPRVGPALRLVGAG